MYTERVNSIIRTHSSTRPEDPLFFYVALQNPHYPLEVPPEYEAIYANESNQYRRVYSGIVTAMDDAIASMVATLQVSGSSLTSMFCLEYVFQTDFTSAIFTFS